MAFLYGLPSKRYVLFAARWAFLFIAITFWGQGAPATMARAQTQPDGVRVALYEDYLPLSGRGLTGQPSGMLADIWRLWSEKTGVPVTLTIGSFAASVEAVRNGSADIHGGLFRTEQRQQWLSFARTVQEAPSYFYYLRDDETPEPTAEELGGRLIGALRGTYQAQYLSEHPLRYQTRTFGTPNEMLWALAHGDIAAVLHESIAMSSILVQSGARGEIARLPEEELRNSIHPAVRRDRPEILALVEYGFSQISQAEFAEIEGRWIDLPEDRFFRDQGHATPLTVAEKRWLSEREGRPIRLGILENWPPLSWTEDGRSVGMTPQIVDLINRELGPPITLVPGEWNQMMRNVRDGTLDGMLDITATRARSDGFRFTSPYLSIPHVIVTRNDTAGIRSVSDLATRTIAIERGFANIEYLRGLFPAIDVLEYATSADALAAVQSGEADAWAGNSAVFRYLAATSDGTLAELTVAANLGTRQSALSIGVTLENDVLRDILQKTVIGLPPADIAEITAPWLEELDGGSIQLTPREQRWLAENRDTVIRIYSGHWPPFHYVRDGEHRGIALRHVERALTLLGLDWDYVDMTWAEAYDAIGALEDIDLLPTVAPSPERAEQIALTRPYLSFPMVIFAQTSEALITGLNDLHGRTVAVERGYIMNQRLQQDYPDINLLLVDTSREALEAVSLGRADAYVGNLAAGTFHIDRHGYSNVKVAAPTEYGDDTQAVGVRRDWPELAGILDRVIAGIPEEEREQIWHDEMAVRFEYGLNWQKIAVYAIPGGTALLIVIFIVVLANRRLSREVAEKVAAERQLSEREQWFKNLLESAPDATLIVNRSGTIVRVNRQAELMFQADREKLIGQPIEILVPDNVKSRHTAYRDGFITSSAPREMGANLKLQARRLDGRLFPVEISLSPIESVQETMIAASVRDVSERREQERILHEKDLQLTAALENMSGGMFMVDKDLIIRVFNRKFIDLYKFPEMSVGTPLVDLMRIRAERGDYGLGDLDQLVQDRIAGYRDNNLAKIEDQVGRTIIEGFRQPTADGGIVCVFNDITARKMAEDALFKQTNRLKTLSEKLSRYLSPQIYEAIFAGATDVTVHTERKKLTVFFSDIKNFTATTEDMEPEDMTFLLNDYLTKMTEIALEYGGTIDKYVGDAILVFFGDPETKGVKEDAQAAVRMAITMQRRMVDLRAKWSDMGYKHPFHIRCGINTGYCNVGNFGSDQRMDYTIIGGQVNLAARLESICEPDGVALSYETYSHVRDEVDAVEMEPIQVKGIRDPVKPFALRGIFEQWDSTERYIRRDISGLRLWVDLMRMTEEQRIQSIKELESALEVLQTRETLEEKKKHEDNR